MKQQKRSNSSKLSKQTKAAMERDRRIKQLEKNIAKMIELLRKKGDKI